MQSDTGRLKDPESHITRQPINLTADLPGQNSNKDQVTNKKKQEEEEVACASEHGVCPLASQ